MKVQSLSWTVGHPPAPVGSLWGQGLLPKRGLTLVHGPSKIGKSMLSLNLGLAGARGDAEFLGYEIPEPFTTFIFQGEIHLRGMHERAVKMKERMVAGRAFTEEHLNRIVINEERGRTLADDEFFDEFAATVRWLKPGLIVVDPLAHCLTTDENSNTEVGRMLMKLGELRDDPGAAIILVHHDSKMSEATRGRPGRQRARGADRLNADPDAIISLGDLGKLKGVGPKSRLEFDLRHGRSVLPFPVVLNENTLWFERMTDKADDLARWVAAAPTGMMTEEELIGTMETCWKLDDKQHRSAKRSLKRALEEETLVLEVVGTERYYKVGGSE